MIYWHQLTSDAVSPAVFPLTECFWLWNLLSEVWSVISGPLRTERGRKQDVNWPIKDNRQNTITSEHLFTAEVWEYVVNSAAVACFELKNFNKKAHFIADPVSFSEP